MHLARDSGITYSVNGYFLEVLIAHNSVEGCACRQVAHHQKLVFSEDCRRRTHNILNSTPCLSDNFESILSDMIDAFRDEIIDSGHDFVRSLSETTIITHADPLPPLEASSLMESFPALPR